MGIVSGPYFTNLSGPGHHDTKTSFRQTRQGGRVPNSYSHTVERASRITQGEIRPYDPASTAIFSILSSLSGGPASSEVDFAYRVAFDRLASKIKAGKSASLGVSIAESAESFQMIARRARDMALFVNDIRKGELTRAIRRVAGNGQARKRALSLSLDARKGVRDVSSVLLETTFGWVPMIQDIYSAVDVLQSDLASGWVRSRGGASYSYSYASDDGNYTETRDASIYVELRCRVSVSNPNVALANQLGLINPAQVAWDVVPFSFLVNWFLPVSSFLESYSTFWGWDMKDCFRTDLRRASSTQVALYPPSPFYNSDTYANGYAVHRRPTALPVPTFKSRIRLPGGDLRGKAISSIALLVQSLTR